MPGLALDVCNPDLGPLPHVQQKDTREEDSGAGPGSRGVTAPAAEAGEPLAEGCSALGLLEGLRGGSRREACCKPTSAWEATKSPPSGRCESLRGLRDR